jgi:hypothetical protein
MPILRYNGSLVAWTVVSLTTAKLKPFIFSMSGFILSYTTNTFILMILYDFCLSPAQFCYIIGFALYSLGTDNVENTILLQTAQKAQITWLLSTVGVWRTCACAEVFTESLPRSGMHNPVVPLLHVGPCVCCAHCLAMDLHITIYIYFKFLHIRSALGDRKL